MCSVGEISLAKLDTSEKSNWCFLSGLATGQRYSDQACLAFIELAIMKAVPMHIVYSQICSLFKPIQCEIEMKPFSEILIFVGEHSHRSSLCNQKTEKVWSLSFGGEIRQSLLDLINPLFLDNKTMVRKKGDVLFGVMCVMAPMWISVQLIF